jgi:hypothetical protein
MKPAPRRRDARAPAQADPLPSADETREENARRLQFSDADRAALAWVPPGPLSMETCAELGQEWAVRVLAARDAHESHTNGYKTKDGSWYCVTCQLSYADRPGAIRREDAG